MDNIMIPKDQFRRTLGALKDAQRLLLKSPINPAAKALLRINLEILSAYDVETYVDEHKEGAPNG